MELSLSVSVLSADNNTVKGSFCNVQMPLTLLQVGGLRGEGDEEFRQEKRATAEEQRTDDRI